MVTFTSTGIQSRSLQAKSRPVGAPFVWNGPSRVPTSRPPAPTGEEIAQRAQELKVAHLALMLAVPSIFHPDLPLLQTLLMINRQPLDADLPIYLAHDGSDGEQMVYSAREVLTKATRLRGEIVGNDLMSMSMLLGGTRIGDMIAKGGHSRGDVPLLQFVRHYRNVCAHGDRWNFKPGQPDTAAVCRGLTLTAELHGKRATWESVSPRLYIELLDDVTNYFLPGSVPPPLQVNP